jgi:hypothetical protein
MLNEKSVVLPAFRQWKQFIKIDFLNPKVPATAGFKFPVYCANEILTCSPARVVVIGAVVAIFGITLFCSK